MMKVIRLLAVLTLFALVPKAHSATLVVCPTGCTYGHVQQAMFSALDGDTIFVENGTYPHIQTVIDRENITIEGESQDGVILDAQGLFRHFMVNPTSNLDNVFTVRNLTLRNGREFLPGGAPVTTPPGLSPVFGLPLCAQGVGGSICSNHVKLDIDSVTFLDNEAMTRGGAIHAEGLPFLSPSVSIRNSTFQNNKLLFNSQTPTITKGGAISCRRCDLLELIGNTFVGNESAVAAPGGSIDRIGLGGAVAVYAETYNLAGNTIPISEHFTVVSRGNRYTKNVAGDHGGAVYIENEHPILTTTFEPHQFSEDTYENNFAGSNGGAVSLVSAVQDEVASFERSLFAGNRSSQNGGAISTNNTSIFVDNSTFAGNSGNKGGAIHINHAAQSTRLFSIANSTLVGNRVHHPLQTGSAIYAYSGLSPNWNPETIVHMSNSILHKNRGLECELNLPSDEIIGQNNLTDDTTCNFNNTSSSGSPAFNGVFSLGGVTGLAPRLSDNGGPTLTFAIDRRSNAFNTAADNCPRAALDGSSLRFDQRNVSRGSSRLFSGDDNCDIGSFEVSAPSSYKPSTQITHRSR